MKYQQSLTGWKCSCSVAQQWQTNWGSWCLLQRLHALFSHHVSTSWTGAEGMWFLCTHIPRHGLALNALLVSMAASQSAQICFANATVLLFTSQRICWQWQLRGNTSSTSTSGSVAYVTNWSTTTPKSHVGVLELIWMWFSLLPA